MAEPKFSRGAILEKDDLYINLVDNSGTPVDAYDISFAIFDVTTGSEVQIGPSEREPAHPEVGTYWAPVRIPRNANRGLYRIRWTFKRNSDSNEATVMEEFEVIRRDEAQSEQFDENTLSMIGSLRNMLRDNNPDKNYHFRPPTSEGVMSDQNEVFAYLWEDHELVEYLKRSVDRINMHPPETNYSGIQGIVNKKPAWRTMMLVGSIIHACFALSMNWTTDEFSYDIGGISLDISKADMYSSRMDSAEQRFKDMLEAKERTVKVTRGLKQSRYGVGVRSAFGPHTHEGAMTPQKFIGF
jgi:hypothetical protein